MKLEYERRGRPKPHYGQISQIVSKIQRLFSLFEFAPDVVAAPSPETWRSLNGLTTRRRLKQIVYFVIGQPGPCIKNSRSCLKRGKLVDLLFWHAAHCKAKYGIKQHGERRWMRKDSGVVRSHISSSFWVMVFGTNGGIFCHILAISHNFIERDKYSLYTWLKFITRWRTDAWVLWVSP